MRQYWTCSKFADWLRGTAKPQCGTSEEWSAWEKAAKATHKIRYWLAEDGLRALEDAVLWVPNKLHSIKCYFNNRFVNHTHALTAHPRDIKRGQWRDVGDRFLPCMFNELQDFVETELAWWHVVWADKEARAKYNVPWYATGFFRFGSWRCPQAGLDNLDWQSKLVHDDEWMDKNDPHYGKPTHQAIKAQELLALYTWWTEVYRNRPDPMDASGWSAYCDECRGDEDGVMSMLRTPKDPALKKRGDKALKLCSKIEAQYEKEDEQMMIRLIKVRHGLWT